MWIAQSAINMKHFDTGTVALALKLALLTFLSFHFLRCFSSSRHDDAKQRGGCQWCSVSISGFKALTVWGPLDFLCFVFWQSFTIAPPSPVYHWAAGWTLIILSFGPYVHAKDQRSSACVTVPWCVSVLCEASEIQLFWRTFKRNMRRQGLRDSLSQGEGCQPTAANSSRVRHDCVNRDHPCRRPAQDDA